LLGAFRTKFAVGGRGERPSVLGTLLAE
jgi:hypothetical protein